MQLHRRPGRLVYASRLGSISVGFDGGTYVLYAVAAAVIGGASLFGGYGKPIHPLLGGLVIATLTNGLALLNISTAGTDIATAAVLLVAVAVDATLRRRGRSGRPDPSATAGGAVCADSRRHGTAGAAARPRRWRSPAAAAAHFATTTTTTTTTRRPLPRSPSWTVYHGSAAGTGVAASVTSVDLSSPAWTSPTLDGQLYGEPLVLGRSRLRGHRERHRLRPVGDDRRRGLVDPPRHAGAVGDPPLRRHLPHRRHHRDAGDRPARSEIFVVADELVNGTPAHGWSVSTPPPARWSSPRTSTRPASTPPRCCSAPG